MTNQVESTTSRNPSEKPMKPQKQKTCGECLRHAPQWLSCQPEQLRHGAKHKINHVKSNGHVDKNIDEFLHSRAKNRFQIEVITADCRVTFQNQT